MQETPIKLNEEGEVWYEPQPEDFLPSVPKKKPSIYKLPKRSSSYLSLVFLIISFVISYFHWEGIGHDLSISRFLSIEKNEYWRSITALFVHSDLGHFMNNSWLLFLFGWFLTDFSGKRAFPWISLIIGAVTNIITVMSMPMYTRLVGASGMVYGMVAFWLVVYFRHTPLSWKSKLIRSIGFVLMLLFPTTYSPTTSYMAHGVGFLVGMVFGLIYIFSPIDKKRFDALETI